MLLLRVGVVVSALLSFWLCLAVVVVGAARRRGCCYPVADQPHRQLAAQRRFPILGDVGWRRGIDQLGHVGVECFSLQHPGVDGSEIRKTLYFQCLRSVYWVPPESVDKSHCFPREVLTT